MSTITTIKIYQKTKVNLERFKEYKRESYDDVLKKLLYIIYLLEKDPEKGKKLLEEIESIKRVLQKRRYYEKSGPEIMLKH